jgi:uncharacterized membrane protein
MRRPSCPGAWLALVSGCLSVTPSLLPRTWLVQSIVTGLSAAVGYGVGAGLGRLAARLTAARTRRLPTRSAWIGLGALGVPMVVVSAWHGLGDQRELRRLMGASAAPADQARVLVVALAVVVVLVAVARGLRWAAQVLGSLLGRWLAAPAARTVAAGLVSLTVVGMAQGVVGPGVLRVVRSVSASDNAGDAGRSAPTVPERSGSAWSLVGWGSLGMQGRSFVTGGPSQAQLQEFGGRTPRQPIRVYVGLTSAGTAADQAALAVRELWRTGAFSRQVLCVVTATGTGWVDPWAANSLEYLYDGDTAIVAMQYSYLPSWASYLVEPDKAAQAGRALFETVYAAWSRRPVQDRPRLLVFGESLGSLGGEAAFNRLEDLRTRSDGALWVGPTSANELWNRLVAERDRDSTQSLPTFGQGREVLFANGAEDLMPVPGGWSRPRVVYLQHASDPITWWSPDLLLRRPDWLAEPPGQDRLAAMRWYPVISFLQVTADLWAARTTKAGHGHRFRGEEAAAWAAIAPPPGWTEQDTRRLVAFIDPGS